MTEFGEHFLIGLTVKISLHRPISLINWQDPKTRDLGKIFLKLMNISALIYTEQKSKFVGVMATTHMV